MIIYKPNKQLISRFSVFFCFFLGVSKPSRDYNIQGSSIDKIFTITGAAANLVFAFNSGMLPEIQVSLIYVHATIISLFLTLTLLQMIRPQWSNQWLKTWWRLCIFSSLLVHYLCMQLHSLVIGLTGPPHRLIWWTVSLDLSGSKLSLTSQLFFSPLSLCTYVYLPTLLFSKPKPY